MAIVYLFILVLTAYLINSVIINSKSQAMQKMQDKSISEQERKLILICFFNLSGFLRLGITSQGRHGPPRKYLFISRIVSASLYSLSAFSFTAIFSLINVVGVLHPIQEVLQEATLFPQATASILAFTALGAMCLYYWFEITPYTRAVGKEIQVRQALMFLIFPVYAAKILGEGYAHLKSFISPNRVFMTHCMPFPKSLNVAKMMERSFDNVEGRKCTVMEYKCEITPNEAQDLFGETEKHFELSAVTRSLVNNITSLNPNDVALRVNKFRPILYIGYVEGDCAFFGCVWYYEAKGMQVCDFFFRNRYVNNEFQVILTKGIDKTRDV
jgi:hypothetical protein